MHAHTQYLGVFGWNWSFVGGIKLMTDSEGNITLLNSKIQSLLPQQIFSQHSRRTFHSNADGSYSGDDND